MAGPQLPAIQQLQGPVTAPGGAFTPVAYDYFQRFNGQLVPILTGTLFELAANKGVANGYAALDATGKVPAVELPPPVFPSWVPYAPLWTATGGGPSLGNGSLQGTALALGPTTLFTVQFVFGSTTTPGTGLWGFSLPGPSVINLALPVAIQHGGVFFSGTAFTPTPGSTLHIVTENEPNGVTGTSPFVWQPGDYLFLNGFLRTS